jgi:hypothetical protein
MLMQRRRKLRRHSGEIVDRFLLSIPQASRGTACGYLAGIRTPFCTVPTDEELMIAEHTSSLLWDRHSSSNSNRKRAS